MSGQIVVLISGSGSNLDALAEACKRGEVPGELSAVVADRDCLGLRVAEKRGLATEVLEPKDFDDREDWSAELRNVVARFQPDLVVSAGFMRILSPVFTDHFYGRLINLHPALLPAFPGAHAVRDALAARVTETGSTVHFIDAEVDHGPTIMQEIVLVRPDDTEESLHSRIKEVEHRLLPKAVRLFLEGKIHLAGDKVTIDAN